MRDYKKYDIWKLSHLLTLEVYKITESFPKEEIFGLTSQIRRASSSIGINIVEDIVDTGNTIESLYNYFENTQRPKSLKVATLLLKPEVYKKDFKIHYVAKVAIQPSVS